MSASPNDIRFSGAVTIGGSSASPSAVPSPTGGSTSAAVIDVTEATFAAEVVERSRTVPVVVDLWAAWCGPCRQLSPVLEKLADAGGGSWLLAKVDVDANPRIAQAFGVQGIPAVKAVWQGQLVDEFTGAIPEAQVRQWLQGILALAGGEVAADGVEPAVDPMMEDAVAAVRRGDLAAATAAFEDVLSRHPGDELATTGLARVKLLERTRGLDDLAVRRQAQADPADLDAVLAAADLDVLHGHVDEAFDGLLKLVRTLAGDDRDRVRDHLLSLFAVLEPDDPRVPVARRRLSSALF